MIDAAEKAREDRNAMLAHTENEGMEKGEEQGIKQGILAGKLETAKKMLAMNASVEFIHEATGLAIESIQMLRM